VCIHGRSDVPGPLCHVLLGRDNVAYVIAAGKANHAGPGSWRGLSGNSSVFGLEVEHVGTTAEPLSGERRESMVQIHAAFAEGRFDASWVCQHYEWTTRKIDFVRALLDPDRFRADIARAISVGDDMSAEAERKIDEIHDALYVGVPSYGQGAILGVVNQINYSIAGIGEKSLRVFIRDQDQRTRELTQDAIDDLWRQIEQLANEGSPGGPVNVSPADRQAIARAVLQLLADHPLAPQPPI
jgi:hypothetical protein